MINQKINKGYYYLLKYFYSWYVIPHILLHEGCHILMATIFGIKIKRFKFFKSDKYPLYNAVVNFEYKKYNTWKWLMVSYAPLLLLIPVLLMFLNTILFCIGAYFISTIIFINKKPLWICLPSGIDLKYLDKLKYYSYLRTAVTEQEFNYYVKKNELHLMLLKNNLLNEMEFYMHEKQNKNKK